MGEQKVSRIANDSSRAELVRHLLNDVRALEIMLEKNLFERGTIRIGAEQEFFLVDENWKPSDKALHILEEIGDPHFTTEIGLYNLEINLDPVELGGHCFSQTSESLSQYLNLARQAAEKFKNKVLMTGILPTIRKSELMLDFITPMDRYYALNDMLRSTRGSDFEVHLMGVDELNIKHDTVLFEACNTSFQLHLQIDPLDMVRSYNWAQMIAGPVLSVCCNSPLLLGRELWRETRIGLFQQSIDTRSSSYTLKDQEARVTFGHDWIRESIAEIYKEDIARFSILLGADIEKDSLEELAQGKTPKLKALSLHNGTVYRWNRPCYGRNEQKEAHLRIECRYLPSGPTVIDEMANFAFWVGLMRGRPERFDHIKDTHDFREVKSNFFKAARNGKETLLYWDDEFVPADRLVRKKLLPIAYEGLRNSGIDADEIEQYLGVIERRTRGVSGAKWISRNYRRLRRKAKLDDALTLVTQAIHQNQMEGKPVHEWKNVEHQDIGHWTLRKVNQIMTTELFTVNENDFAELVTKIMQWKDIHHIPVENNRGNLVGLLTWTNMLAYMKEGENGKLPAEPLTTVRDIMVREVITIQPSDSVSHARELMIRNQIGCLPVLKNDQLVGIITKHDLHDE